MLAENLEGFLARLREKTETVTVHDRPKVLRSVVKEALAGRDGSSSVTASSSGVTTFSATNHPLRWESTCSLLIQYCSSLPAASEC